MGILKRCEIEGIISIVFIFILLYLFLFHPYFNALPTLFLVGGLSYCVYKTLIKKRNLRTQDYLALGILLLILLIHIWSLYQIGVMVAKIKNLS